MWEVTGRLQMRTIPRNFSRGHGQLHWMLSSYLNFRNVWDWKKKMQKEVWLGTTHKVLNEVPILVIRFFFPKQSLSVSVDNLITRQCTFDKRSSLKTSFWNLWLLKCLDVAGNLPLCFWIQTYKVHRSRDSIRSFTFYLQFHAVQQPWKKFPVQKVVSLF